jgi:hypothetical protein
MENNSLQKKLRVLHFRYGSDAAAARAIGITPTWFCAIKKGRRNPGPSLLRLIEILSKQTLAEILTD